MFISDRMTRTVLTAREDDTIQAAADRMAERRVHQLPVVRGEDRLIGIVTDRDVRGVHGEAARADPVRRIMTANPVTVAAGAPLEEALVLLHLHRFGSLPVVTPAPVGAVGDEALPRLVGIITHTDLLSAFIDLLGVEEPGTRLDIQLPEPTAAHVCNALHAVGRCQARIISLVMCGPRSGRAGRLCVRLSTIDARPALDGLAEAGYRLAEPPSGLS